MGGANDYLTPTAVSNRFETRPNNTVVKNAIQTEQKSGHDAFEDCKNNSACTAFSWDFSTSPPVENPQFTWPTLNVPRTRTLGTKEGLLVTGTGNAMVKISGTRSHSLTLVV